MKLIWYWLKYVYTRANYKIVFFSFCLRVVRLILIFHRGWIRQANADQKLYRARTKFYSGIFVGLGAKFQMNLKTII